MGDKILNRLFLALFLLAAACQSPDQNINGSKGIPVYEKLKLVYPNGYPDSSVFDEYHAVQVSDSYRWLEDYSNNASRWVNAQQALTEQYFDQVPLRRRLENRLEKYWDYERFSLPIKRGDRFFFSQNDGLQQQDLVVQLDDPEGTPKVLIDPNQFGKDVVLQNFKASNDGTKMAYQYGEDGSSWRNIKIINLETQETYPEVLAGVKFSCISWFGDGFFYARFNLNQVNDDILTKNKFHQLFYHKLGTSQEEDEMVFADRHSPYSMIDATTTQDEHFLVLKIKKNTLGNSFWFKDLTKEDSEFQILEGGYDYEYTLIDNVGDNFLIKTNYKAPKGRMILVNANQPDEAYWQELIPETNEVLQTAELVNNKMIACYLKETYSVVKVYDMNGGFIGNLDMPEKGKVKCFEGERDDPLAFFGFSTLTKPMATYSVDVDAMKIKPFRIPKVSFEVKGYKTEQVWFKSHDGTNIPMYIVHKKGLKLDGNRKTLLVVNGGLGQKLLPQFNPTGLHLLPHVLENDGVCAVVNVRGGIELGKQWQLNGIQTKKENSIKDFQAATEYLITHGITNPNKLAVYGKENGALIAAASFIQRPDLFKVVIAEDGIFDMMRYDQFSTGWSWAAEFGSIESKRNFEHLYGYSPVHNVVNQEYPAILLLTGRQNDVVPALHSYKLLASLQRFQKGENPVLLSVDDDGYSNYLTALDNKIRRAADVIAFMDYNLDERLPQ